MEEIGIDNARKDLGGIVDRARLAGERTVITRAGKPAAKVVPVDDADHVPRLKAWLAAHPRCTIEVRDGMWVCLDGGASADRYAGLAVAYDLGILLDKLEAEEPRGSTGSA